MRRLATVLVGFGFLSAAGGLAAAIEPALNKSLNEQVIFVEHGTGLFSVRLETTIFKPDGDGPFPLVLINHGKDFGNPAFQPRARYIVAAREFVRRGYVVAIPMRGGFSKSTGSYIGGGCNVAGNGQQQAEYIRSALDHLVRQPFIDRSRILVLGQSHGGLATVAFGSSPYPGVLGLINFAGGIKQDQCAAWERNLVAAYAEYGAKNRLPSLWFYGDNDSYWTSALAREMHGRYVEAGGVARFVAIGSFKSDAHKLFGDRDGLARWWPEVESFVDGLGLPTALVAKSETPVDPAAQRLGDFTRVPYVQASERCRKNYELFLDADYPRAFAVSAAGRCGYAYGGEDPGRRAIEFCRGKTEQECVIYAVDDRVVWE